MAANIAGFFVILQSMNKTKKKDSLKYIKISRAVGLTALVLLAFSACRQSKGFDAATAETSTQITGYGTEDYALPARNEIPELSTNEDPATETGQQSQPAADIKPGPRFHERIHINRIGPLAKVFNDSNKYQYAAAERLGLRPLTSLGLAYFTSRPIVEVQSNQFYTVDSLKHSFPYLVPEAEKLLRDIGGNFIDSLARRGADSYRIIVTSLLRTPHTVKRLRRVNRNAVDSSTHQFGTTFDISWARFHSLDSTRTINEEDLKNLLAEVLLDLRNQKRCLVKYERTGCFHITATR